MRVASHEATTAQLGAAFPFVATRPLPGAGLLVGKDLFGDAFVHDPFELYRAGVLTNPNMLVLGQIGRGKSAFVKSYLYRHVGFGRRVVVFDPKGEYGPFAAAVGARPIALRPGGEVRLNPLGVVIGAGDDRESHRRNCLAALVGVAGAALRRDLHPFEHAALELALDATIRDCDVATIPHVVEALLFPDSRAATAIGERTETLHRDGRDVALELRRLVSGELAGMFDGETSRGVDLAAPVVVIDLSALYRSDALGVVVACARGALEGALQREATGQTILVVDEAWAVLANPGATSFLQSSFKLARAFGVANIAVVHRISDLQAAGAAGSAERSIAEGLIADCETIVCYAQSPAELEVTRRVLGLGIAEARLLAGLRRGVALWRIGARSFLVEHRLGPRELDLVDTDKRLLEDRP